MKFVDPGEFESSESSHMSLFHSIEYIKLYSFSAML